MGIKAQLRYIKDTKKCKLPRGSNDLRCNYLMIREHNVAVAGSQQILTNKNENMKLRRLTLEEKERSIINSLTDKKSIV